MRVKNAGRVEGMQLDKDGHTLGTLIKTAFGPPVLILEPGFLLVKIPETGRVRIYDCERKKLSELGRVELVTNEQ